MQGWEILFEWTVAVLLNHRMTNGFLFEWKTSA
jgi:hypothetical protein